MSSQPESGRGRPGRYQRSGGGLIGALLITVGAVAGFVVFRAINRDELEVRPEAVDYLATVRTLQESGQHPVYPSSLPADWLATSVQVEPGRGFSWGVGMLTADQEFVGVRDSERGLQDLLRTFVDEHPVAGRTVQIDGAIATDWQTWSDDGGDHAYAATVAGRTVLVFGSASDTDLRAVVSSLTAAPAAG